MCSKEASGMTVKFDKRVTGINISGIRKMFEGAGPGAINLGLGQPDFDTPEHIKAEAIKAIEEGFTGYTGNMGMPSSGSLVAKFRKRTGVSYLPTGS